MPTHPLSNYPPVVEAISEGQSNNGNPDLILFPRRAGPCSASSASAPAATTACSEPAQILNNPHPHPNFWTEARPDGRNVTWALQAPRPPMNGQSPSRRQARRPAVTETSSRGGTSSTTATQKGR